MLIMAESIKTSDIIAASGKAASDLTTAISDAVAAHKGKPVSSSNKEIDKIPERKSSGDSPFAGYEKYIPLAVIGVGLLLVLRK